MRTLIVTLVVLFVGQIASAQTADSLLGTWKYKSIYAEKGKSVDPASLKMADAMFADLTIKFEQNGVATLSMMGKDEDGQWTYDEKKKTATVKSKTGKETLIVIDKYETDTMHLQLGKALVVVSREE
ncbi:MAG: hypothetical protein H6607_04735 [Flavobacteriales bacterium]|nr:hypothetical protein [Flavobacteriales bacterium]